MSNVKKQPEGCSNPSCRWPCRNAEEARAYQCPHFNNAIHRIRRENIVRTLSDIFVDGLPMINDD